MKNLLASIVTVAVVFVVAGIPQAGLGESPTNVAPSSDWQAPFVDLFHQQSTKHEATEKLSSLKAEDISAGQQFRSWFRDQFVTEADLLEYGISMDADWQELSAEKDVVILLHGFNSKPEDVLALLAPARELKRPCGTFAYPNDHTLRESAELLAKELDSFAQQHPRRRVVLVCHSMGGLVARACVENPTLDPGNVDQMIMIAPPTHGTLVAHFAAGTDLWEHWLARSDGWPWTRLRDSIVDGMGEAADELRPGSAFLTELNGRPRNPGIRYSIVLGTAGIMQEEQRAWIRDSMRETVGRVPGIRGTSKELDQLLADMEELIEGKGDGVVAVSRGRLKGVKDTLVLPFGHLSVANTPDTKAIRRVHEVVLKRLN